MAARKLGGGKTPEKIRVTGGWLERLRWEEAALNGQMCFLHTETQTSVLALQLLGVGKGIGARVRTRATVQ